MLTELPNKNFLNVFIRYRADAGYTLVELLVVIAIIAVLVTASAILLDPVRQTGKAKDSKAQQDVKSVSTAASLCLSYVDPQTGIFNTPSSCDSIAKLSGTCGAGCNPAGGPFMKAIPSGSVLISSTATDICIAEMGATVYWKFTSARGNVYSDASGC